MYKNFLSLFSDFKERNMSKTLILAEKPSVGKELARVLKCNQNKGSYIEGNKYILIEIMYLFNKILSKVYISFKRTNM